MNENAFVKETFQQLAPKGYLGDPNGARAYCYLRVSTAQQAEEGRSGLPRQLLHCHEAALKHHLMITWDMVFTDDGFSGFEFEQRPALSQLRAEIKRESRSRYVVIEHLDRLSRNARWHQGFILEEFSRYRIAVIFWKAFSSEIERAVMGTIAEEGMRAEILRMSEGLRLKAKSGRVTAKRPRFGYMFVDSEGKVSDKVRKDTHYALHPEKSKIVRWIYDSLIHDHKTLGRIAAEMNSTGIPPIFTSAVWCVATIAHMIYDPVYKGEFYAHRWYREETGELNMKGRPKGISRERPKEEWIRVDVPPIVTPEEWARAKEISASNRKRSSRNMKKRQWLLSSLLKCDICKYGYNAIMGGTQNRPIRYYGCNGRNSLRAKMKGIGCRSPYVYADKMEAFVWSKVEELVTNPSLVLKLLDKSTQDEELTAENQKREYLDGQLNENTTRYERWKKAYEEEVITLAEYKDYRETYKKRHAELSETKQELERQCAHRLSYEEKKCMVLVGLAELSASIPQDANREEIPLEIKQNLVRQLVDTIWVDSEQKTIRLEGVLKASYAEVATTFVFGCNPRSR